MLQTKQERMSEQHTTETQAGTHGHTHSLHQSTVADAYQRKARRNGGGGTEAWRSELKSRERGGSGASERSGQSTLFQNANRRGGLTHTVPVRQL